jgi:hypothetical protein
MEHREPGIPDGAFESETRSFVERLAARSDARVCRRQENCCAHIWKAATREADRVVDGGIDMPLLRKFRPDAKDEDLLKPARFADAFWYLAHQDRSAWTHELDVRPF